MFQFLKDTFFPDPIDPDYHGPIIPAFDPQQRVRRLVVQRLPVYPTILNYSDDMEHYINECNRSPISEADADLIEDEELRCCVSQVTPIIPVRLNSKLYDLNELRFIRNFDNEGGFVDPLFGTGQYYKRDIQSARDIKEKIILAIKAKKEKPAVLNNSSVLFQPSTLPAASPVVHEEKAQFTIP